MGRSVGLAVASGDPLIAGRYRLETLLGQGGMGAVYAATDTTTGKKLALKTTSRTASAKVLELFKREFHTLHGLRHPNIIEVYDYGTDGDFAFYTMELLEGGDLATAAPLPWRQVCSYLRQVATLLGLLHARRLLHRDVTPRNLWVLPDGRLKLIDFGALSRFGVPTEVVGTPPFIAPEWLYQREAGIRVDQRADLYALGALAYWLLTSAHAYSARSIQDLPRAWAREPAPPSSLAKLVENRALPPIPPELDELVLSLLRSDASARPETTETLIDRIDAIAGPVEEPVDHAVRGYVRSKAFVGRRLERSRIADRVRRREGGAFAVEGAPGMGRSRLLDELALEARLTGATSVLVRPEAPEPSYGVAARLALALLTALPKEAAAAARAQAAVLAQLSPEVQRRLEVPGTVTRDPTPGGREQLQRALTEWLFELALDRRLVLFVDDLEQNDEESASFVASLSPYGRERGFVLVAAVRQEPGGELPMAVQLFCDAAQRVPLPPLSAAEVLELLHSVFGPAMYLERIADCLHRVSQGNPAHALELVEHLVDRGIARYTEGAWLLPGHLSEEELPGTRSEMHLGRLAALGDHARRLAEVLSLHDGRLALADCRAASELSEGDTAVALVELTLRGVLIESDQGYTFSHASLRERLAESLAPERRAAAHARIGASLAAAATDTVDGLRAALHFYEAGDVARCDQLMRAVLTDMLEAKQVRSHVAVPLLERAVALYRAAGRGRDALLAPLTALCAASFYADRRLADRYGLETLDTLETLLRFDRVRSWRRFIGPKPALIASLVLTGFAQRARGKGALRVPDLLRMLAGVAIALNGVATSSLDLEMTARCRRALEPFAGIGEGELIGLVRRAIDAIGSLLSETPAATHQKLRVLCETLESDVPIPKLSPGFRREFLGGCLMTLGIMESWRQRPVALAIADRIEPIGPMHAVNADHLRSMYYFGRGDTQRAEHYRQRVETHALRAGAAWQIAAIGPIGSSFLGLWNHDAALAKRGAAELERLSQQLPSFRYEARRARATYLVLTGRYREAIETMQASDEPRTAGWVRGQGILLRAYNRAGEHAKAREAGRAAIAGKSDEDLSFTMMSLHLQIELVLADAALGDFTAAREHCDTLLVRFADNGAIAVGTLHETRARVALLERDFEACRKHCAAMRRSFAATDIATLRELSDRLHERVAEAERGTPDAVQSPAALLADDAHLMTRMRLLLSHTEGTFERRARMGLSIAFELTGAQAGFVYSRVHGPIAASDDVPDDPELVRWAEAQLDASEADATAILVPEQTLGDTALFIAGELRYCVVPLGQVATGEPAPVALVLGFRGIAPRAPSADVLATLARHLASVTQAND